MIIDFYCKQSAKQQIKHWRNVPWTNSRPHAKTLVNLWDIAQLCTQLFSYTAMPLRLYIVVLVTWINIYLIFSKAALKCCPGIIWNDWCYSRATKVTKFDLAFGADKQIFNLKTKLYWLYEHMNSQYDQFPVGLIAQLVEYCTGIAEVMGSNPVQAWMFFRLSFCDCLKCPWDKNFIFHLFAFSCKIWPSYLC